MRKTFTSTWFPVLLMALISMAAYAYLQPSGADIGNSQILSAAKISGWAIGPIAGFLSLLVIAVLKLLQKMIGMSKLTLLNPIIALIGIVPWVIISWNITGEPRFTPFARAVIDFAARPLLWGSLFSSLFVIVIGLSQFIPSKK